MGMESFGSNDTQKNEVSESERARIMDQIDEFKNVEQAAINEYNAILDEKADSGDKEQRMDVAKRKQIGARSEIDQLERSLRPNDWK